MAYLDSAATDHFATPTFSLNNITPIDMPNLIFLSNRDYMLPETSGELPNLLQIEIPYKQAQIYSTNKNSTLISLGRLCNRDCLAITDKHKTIMYKQDKPILKVPRYKKTGMYLINLNNSL